MNNFLEPRLSADFPHYVIRRSIFHFLKAHSRNFTGRVVDLGCGNMPYREWIRQQAGVTEYIGIDLEASVYYQNPPDLSWNGERIPLADESVDVILLTEVMEHLSNPAATIKEIFRVLRRGGTLIGTTPFFWPVHEAPNDMQRMTPYGLGSLLETVPFTQKKVTGIGGWHVALAQFLSVYIAFGLKNAVARRLSATLFRYPILWLSRRIDIVDEFPNKAMFISTGFVATK